jgi:hypothetical protein
MPEDSKTDEQILADGVLALISLEEHAQSHAGIPVLDSSVCRPCMRYAAAVLRGSDPPAAVHLRCAESRQWFIDAVAAYELAKHLRRDA